MPVCPHILHNFPPNIIRNFVVLCLALGEDVVKNLDPIISNNVLYVAFLPVTPEPGRQEEEDRLNQQGERDPLVILVLLLYPAS